MILELTKVEGASFRHFRDGKRIVVDILKPEDTEEAPVDETILPEELRALAASQEESEDPTGKEEAPAPQTEPAPWDDGVSVPVSVYADEAHVVLEFQWPVDVGAAAFRRGDFAWILFDRAAQLDLGSLDGRFQDVITDAAQQAHENAVLVRVGIRGSTLVSVEREGATWRVLLGEEIRKPAQPLAANRILNGAERGEVAIPLPGLGRVVSFIDPEVGDRLVAVTIDSAPHGFVAPRTFVDVAVLGSAHGVALDPIAEDLTVEWRDGTVRVTRPDGLIMSGPDTRVERRGARLREMGPGFIDLEGWARGGRARFTDNQRLLQADLRSAEDPEKRNAARLALAQFFAANGFTVEALGIMELVAADDPEAVQAPQFRALRGVLRLWINRPREALDDLDHHSLRFDPSAALWRGTAHAALEEWTEARAALETGRPALGAHGAQEQARFLLAQSRAALGVNDIGGAQEALKRVDADKAGQVLGLETLLLQGQVHEALGAPDRALEDYGKVLAGGHLPTRAQAAFRTILVEERLGLLETDQAIERLEALRFQWRGDKLELAVLHKLGMAYVETARIRQGLVIMRLAVQSFPGFEKARDVADDMSQVFEDLYLGKGADAMPPVQALALFYDFPELVPVGTKGDDMIRRLADRLVEVDLLEQAAELLDHQVKFRLRGVARSQVATKLAVVHLMDRKPAKALQIIRATRQTRLPERLNRQRRLLEARALADLERYDNALEVIEGYNTLDAHRLRSDVLWQAEDWPRAAATLESLVARLSRAGTFENEDRLNIMRAAIAYALAEDAPALARLRQQFAPLVAGSPDERAFDIVTQRIETQGVAFRELASKIAATDTFDAFMASFRQDFEGTGAGG